MIYRCLICGHIHNEESTGTPLVNLEKCPVCGQKIENFVEAAKSERPESTDDLAYPMEYAKSDKNVRAMDLIHEMAMSAKSVISAMGTDLNMPGWDDILIMGCQLNPQPLERDVDVNTRTVIGKSAKKPLVIETPIYVTHMSFGALSREMKIALSKATSVVKTAQCSGEGGILAEEKENAYRYIFEYVPNRYSLSDENLKSCDAIEIKIGQSTKPGLGGQLEGVKVTEEIVEIRNIPEGRDIHSPATIPGISTKEDLKNLVDELRLKSKGRPIGLKLAAGRIEDDLEHAVYSGADFVTLDGRGGSTGASPKIIRDATSVPTVYALSRARRFLDYNGSDMSLIITGGLRISSDFAKALAMGADAVAIGTAALMAGACQQYRICQSGQCPLGVATQDANLRKRLDIEKAAKRVENFLNVSTQELKTFARITGHRDVHDLNVSDLKTLNSEISDFTNVEHV